MNAKKNQTISFDKKAVLENVLLHDTNSILRFFFIILIEANEKNGKPKLCNGDYFRHQLPPVMPPLCMKYDNCNCYYTSYSITEMANKFLLPIHTKEQIM